MAAEPLRPMRSEPHLNLDLTFRESRYFQVSFALLHECPEQRMTAGVMKNSGILLTGRYGFVMKNGEFRSFIAKTGFKRVFSTKHIV